MNLGVAGQHLLDQRRPGAGQAEDENRPPAREPARPAARRTAIKPAQQAVNEPLVFGHGVVAAFLVHLDGQSVRLAQAFGGPDVVASTVEDVGQGEQQPAARATA